MEKEVAISWELLAPFSSARRTRSQARPAWQAQPWFPKKRKMEASLGGMLISFHFAIGSCNGALENSGKVKLPGDGSSSPDLGSGSETQSGAWVLLSLSVRRQISRIELKEKLGRSRSSFPGFSRGSHRIGFSLLSWAFFGQCLRARYSKQRAMSF